MTDFHPSEADDQVFPELFAKQRAHKFPPWAGGPKDAEPAEPVCRGPKGVCQRWNPCERVCREWEASAPAAPPLTLPAEPSDRIERLKDAIEGECDGLVITDAHAKAILEYVDGAASPPPADSSVHPAVQASLRAIRSAILNGKKSYEVGDVSGGAAWAEVAANRVEEALTPHTPDA